MLNSSVPKENFGQRTVWDCENWTCQGHPQRWAVTSLAGLVHSTLGESIAVPKG